MTASTPNLVSDSWPIPGGYIVVSVVTEQPLPKDVIVALGPLWQAVNDFQVEAIKGGHSGRYESSESEPK